jgi:hypothetical protein
LCCDAILEDQTSSSVKLRTKVTLGLQAAKASFKIEHKTGRFPKFVRKFAIFVTVKGLKIIIRDRLYRVALMLSVALKRPGGVPKSLFRRCAKCFFAASRSMPNHTFCSFISSALMRQTPHLPVQAQTSSFNLVSEMFA